MTTKQVPRASGIKDVAVRKQLDAIREAIIQIQTNPLVSGQGLITANDVRNIVGASTQSIANFINRGYSWVEMFEESNTLSNNWTDTELGNGTVSIVDGDGVAGGKVAQADGYAWWAGKENIPYVPEWKYQITARIRRTATSSNGQDRVYIGVVGVSSDGETLINTTGGNSQSSQHYVAALGLNLTSYVVNEWVYVKGYFQGHGAPSVPANDPQSPTPLMSGVSYIRPLFLLNYNAGDGIQQIDMITIEVIDTYQTTALIDNAGLGDTANWSEINDDNGNMPADNATVGAIWGLNVGNQPPDQDILNSQQLWDEIIGANKPEDNATVGAVWDDNVVGQPTNAQVMNSLQEWNDVQNRPLNNDILNSVVEARLDASVKYQSSQPATGKVGDVWVNSSTNQMYVYRAGAWQALAPSTQFTSGNISTFFANGAIGNAQIGNAAIGSANIQDAAITSAKIALAAIGTAQIADASIIAAKIQSLAADNIIGGTIGAYTINLGSTKFIIDGINRRIDIRDNNDVLRVRIGFDGSDYGIELFNGLGTKFLDADGRGLFAANSAVDQGDGVTYRNIARGLETGNARDGDIVNFTAPWDSIPTVKLIGSGLSYSDVLTGPQFQDFRAVNISTTGFTVSARLRELASSTVNNLDAGAVIGTLGQEMHKSQASEAFDDKYDFTFNVTVNNEFEQGQWLPGSVLLGIYTNDGGGWVKRGTYSFNGDFSGSAKIYTGEVRTVIVDGLTNHSGREFGITVESSSAGGSVSLISVGYTTATVPSDVSATPVGTPDLQYLVLGGE